MENSDDFSAPHISRWARDPLTYDTAADTFSSIHRTLSELVQDRHLDIFPTGAYVNGTQVSGRSALDIVLMSRHGAISPERHGVTEKSLLARFAVDVLRREIVDALTYRYGLDLVDPWDAWCVRVAPHPGRVAARLVPAHIYWPSGERPMTSTHGIYTQSTTGQAAVAYPRQHTDGLSQKDRQTGGALRATVRHLKLLAARAEDTQLMAPSRCRSYLLESLAFNAPAPLLQAATPSTPALLDWFRTASEGILPCPDGRGALTGGSDPKFLRSDVDEVVTVLKRLATG